MKFNVGDKVYISKDCEVTIRSGIIKDVRLLEGTTLEPEYLVLLNKAYDGEKGRYKWFNETYLECKHTDKSFNSTGSLEIKKIIFSGSKTIVFWSDGTKTIVSKSENEDCFDPSAAFCAAYTKKMFGSMNKVKKAIRDKSNYEEYLLEGEGD